MRSNRLRAARHHLGALAVLPVLFALGLVAAPASAAGSPSWMITSSPEPTRFVPGSTNAGFVVTATNVGDASTEGPIKVSDSLPGGDVSATEVFGDDAYRIN